MLTLADGSRFVGTVVGGAASGEAVFTTAMLGFEETLTDPSYAGQVLIFTAAHVGNTPVTGIESESARVQPSAVVFNAKPAVTLADWLQTHGVPFIYGVDTRRLVAHLRDHGAQNCTLTAQFEGTGPRAERRFKVIAYDFGTKRSIHELLWRAGADVTVVPPSFKAEEVLALQPDGVFLGNGPGDPAHYDISEIKTLLGRLPVFGICLGHQLLARALGANTYKLPFGHRGVNHAVRDHETDRVLVTVQNHGYAVGELPPGVQVTHSNVNDGSIEGISSPEMNAFSVQFHPEAAPGPHDTHALFWRFGNLCLEGHAQ